MDTNAKAGDVIFTGGTYIALVSDPEYSEFHHRFYAGGRRYIKSKKRFSTSVLRHNFKDHVVLTEEEKKNLPGTH